MAKKKENKIFVFYIGILNQDNEFISNKIDEYVNEVSNRIISSNIDGEIIVIPTFSQNTKIECINPEYITDQELIIKHQNLIKILNENIEKNI
jgi:hypothetical protein